MVCGFSLELIVLFPHRLGLFMRFLLFVSMSFMPVFLLLWSVLIVWPFWLGLLNSLDELALSDVNVRPASRLFSELAVVGIATNATDATVESAISSRLKSKIGLQYRLLPDLDWLSWPDEAFTLVLPLLEDNRIELSLLDQHSEDVLLIFVFSLQNVALLLQFSR